MFIKNTIAAAAVAGCVSLGGCGSTGTLPTDIATILAQISAITTQICGYAVNPTAAEISAIVKLLGGGVDLEAIAVSICAAVKPVSVAGGRFAGARRGRGLYVHGHFVR